MSYMIVYIGAEWCTTCKTIKPQVEKLANKFCVSYTILDYDADLKDEDKETITKVPTVRIYVSEKKIQEYTIKQVESLELWLQTNICLAIDDF